MERPSTSFERYGRHINFVDIHADDDVYDQFGTDGSGARRRKTEVKEGDHLTAAANTKDSFKSIPAYLLDYMPTHRKPENLETGNHSGQGQRNAKQRMILDYCKPEYYRRKYNVDNVGRCVVEPSGNKNAKDHRRLHAVAKAASLKTTRIEPNYALDMGKKFLEVDTKQQRFAEKRKSTGNSQGNRKSPSKFHIEDRIQLVRNYISDVEMRGVNHVEPPEDINPKLAQLISHPSKHPEAPGYRPGTASNRMGPSPTNLSPRKKKVLITQTPSTKARLSDSMRNVKSTVDSCIEIPSKDIVDVQFHEIGSVTNEAFNSIEIEQASSDYLEKKDRANYVEDKDVRNMRRQYDVPKGKVVRGKFVEYTELDKTRISATKVLLVAVKAINYLLLLQKRRELKELEQAASKKLSFVLFLIKVQCRFKKKRNRRIRMEREEAIKKICRVCKHGIMRMIYDIRDKKVDIIKTFLDEYSVQGFKNVVINFRHQVLKCQQWYRIFKSCSKARLIALGRLWDRFLLEIDGYDPAITIPDQEKEKILSKYLRKRRWEYRLTLIEYILRVEGQQLLFTDVRTTHVKNFLFQRNTCRVVPMNEVQEHHQPRTRRISVDGTGKNALYIPQLLESKLDMKKPQLLVYTDPTSREWLKERVHHQYNESKREYKRQIIEKLDLIKKEQKEQENLEILRRPSSKVERMYVRKLLSAVDDHLLTTTAPPVDDLDKLRKWSLAHLRRPTLSYLGQITLSNDEIILNRANASGNYDQA